MCENRIIKAVHRIARYIEKNDLYIGINIHTSRIGEKYTFIFYYNIIYNNNIITCITIITIFIIITLLLNDLPQKNYYW